MNHYTIELQSRTITLVQSTIQIIRSIKIDYVNQNIVSQLLRSCSSIGANYNEALEGESKEDFIHKLSICKKEASETLYWFDLLLTTNPELKEKVLLLNQETMELIKIFAATVATTKRNSQKWSNVLMV